MVNGVGSQQLGVNILYFILLLDFQIIMIIFHLTLYKTRNRQINLGPIAMSDLVPKCCLNVNLQYYYQIYTSNVENLL